MSVRPSCSSCSSSSLLACSTCSLSFCPSHLPSHLTTSKHFTAAILAPDCESPTPLLCLLCKKTDLRSLGVSLSDQQEAVILCKKGCKITVRGIHLPAEDAKAVFDGESVANLCCERTIARRVCALTTQFEIEPETRPVYGFAILPATIGEKDSAQRESPTKGKPLKAGTEALLQTVSLPVSAAKQPPSSNEPKSAPTSATTTIRPAAEERKAVSQFSPGAHRPVPTPQGLRPVQTSPSSSSSASTRSALSVSAVHQPQTSEEEVVVQNVVPDVFEDEDQYLSVFMEILGLEVTEERKQMEFMRTQATIRWFKDQKVVGEAVLESVEELTYGDDVRITDMEGNTAIVTINEINAENSWVNFKGSLDHLYVEYPPDFLPDEDANESSGFFPSHVYTIEFWESGSIKRMKDGLKQFHRGTGVHSQTAMWILGIERPIVNDTKQKVIKPEGVRLNRYQEEAIQFALANELALIQGPPGTGKTATAAVIVYDIFKMVSEQILVCAPSNIAVDQLSLNIARFTDIKVLRVYGKSRIQQGGILPAEDLSLHMKVRMFLKDKYPDASEMLMDKEISVEKAMLSWKIKEDILAIEQDLIEDHNVISCTCAMSTSKKLGGRRFKYLLIDEAGFSAEPETLLPILKGCEHIVLVGDHMQLPPVVKSRVALRCRYGRSMFERLIDIGIEAKMLQLQYRMHPALSVFPSREFYKGKLKDGIEAKDRVMENLSDFWQTHKPMMFLDVNGLEEMYGMTHSYSNADEAELVENILYDLLQLEVPPTSIGIITPYDGQRRYLLEYLSETGRCDLTSVEIKNIDGFQGREKDIIIISCVRSNSDSEIGFLTESRRLNVAITRAKFGLIMVGNVKVLRSGKFWRGLIDEFSRNRCVQDGDALLAEYRQGE